MKLINLLDEVINGNISEDVTFEMYGEKFEGISELGYEKGLSRKLLLGEVELIEDKPKEEIQEEDEGIEKLSHNHEELADIWLIKETINEIIDKIEGEENA